MGQSLSSLRCLKRRRGRGREELIRKEEEEGDDSDTIRSRSPISSPVSDEPNEEDPTFDFPFLRDEKTINWFRGDENRVMIIMRGLSGSGKSTLASKIRDFYHEKEVIICSADDYFRDSSSTGDDSRYKWSREKLGDAHGWCQEKVAKALGATNFVIVDNTNVKRWEMKPYFNMAAERNFRVFLVEPKTPWKFDPEILATRNSHGVGVDVLTSKLEKIMTGIITPIYFGWFLGHSDSKQLTKLSREILRKSLEKCSVFRTDFERFSERSKDVFWSYYGREIDDLIHCTARFCGFRPNDDARDYARRENVQKSLGKCFTLSVFGFVVAKDSFGARVKLDAESLELYAQNESYDQKKSRQYSNAFAFRKNLIVDDQNGFFSSIKFEANLECGENRFYPIQGKGRRAHLTIGTAPGSKSVNTGFDVLDVVKCESKDNDDPCDLFYVSNVGVLRKINDKLWTIYLDRKILVDAVFTGHY